MAHSFHDRILRVNLSTGEVRVERPGVAYFRRYMGGWNIIADVLLREVEPGVDPLGPENKLVFAPSVLTGLAIGGASRNAIGAKSPLSGGFGASEVGGYWGAEFKMAGYDALIVEGKAPDPVYLWIHSEGVEIKPAGHLWGKKTKETQEMIREDLGDNKVRCAMIGQAGENQVSYANIMNGLFDAAGRGGLGAVMGSKNLKAVAVRGAGPLEVADQPKFKELAKYKADMLKNTQWYKLGTGSYLEGFVKQGNLPIRNFRDGEFENVGNLSSVNYLEEIGTGRRDGCFACAARCKKVVRAEGRYSVDPAYGGPEYETAGAFGSCAGVDDIIAVCKANELSNAYGMDTINAGVNISLAMESFEKGLITKEDTGGIDLHFGNAEAVVQLVELIAKKEGFGAWLAMGTGELAERIGPEAHPIAMHVKNQAYPMHEPRFKKGMAISFAVSPTGADHIHALDGPELVAAGDDGLVTNGRLRSLGILEPIKLDQLGPDVVRAAVYGMIDRTVQNCLTLCGFTDIWSGGWSLDHTIQLLNAATGWDVNQFELMKVGERALTLARLYNMREGLTAEDDRLAERTFGPTTSGALQDSHIDPERLKEAIHEYYEMMGWDRNTGVPLASKLQELDVSWAADHILG